MEICEQSERWSHQDNRWSQKERNPTDQLIMVVGLDVRCFILPLIWTDEVRSLRPFSVPLPSSCDLLALSRLVLVLCVHHTQHKHTQFIFIRFFYVLRSTEQQLNREKESDFSFHTGKIVRDSCRSECGITITIIIIINVTISLEFRWKPRMG